MKLLQSAKEIWDHLLQCRITVTVECLPSELKVTADWEPRNNSDSSEWKLALQLSQRICQLRGAPEKDLFASHQIRTISSDQDLLFVETRSIKPSSRYLPTKLVPQKYLCFSPILHDPKVLRDVLKKCTYDDLCNSSLAITTVVLRSNENVVYTTTNFLDLEERSLKKAKGRNTSPCPKQNFKISGMNGVSREASSRIIKSRRSSSTSNYGLE